MPKLLTSALVYSALWWFMVIRKLWSVLRDHTTQARNAALLEVGLATMALTLGLLILTQGHAKAEIRVLLLTAWALLALLPAVAFWLNLPSGSKTLALFHLVAYSALYAALLISTLGSLGTYIALLLFACVFMIDAWLELRSFSQIVLSLAAIVGGTADFIGKSALLPLALGLAGIGGLMAMFEHQKKAHGSCGDTRN